MIGTSTTERFETIIIGGGQAGLSVGYHLRRLGRPFVILDAGDRIGDAWRNRWDSLRLFTPARYDGLDGMPFPADPFYFPTKDEMADYLEAYAERFELPVRTGTRVDRLTLTRSGDRFVVIAGDRRFEADNVVVAMASYQKPVTPALAEELDPGVVQIHSAAYRGPSQLQDGPVLIVGAGNSGAEIARDVAHRHAVWLSGRDVGEIPFRVDGLPGRLGLVRLVIRFLFHHVLSVATPVGRKARPEIISKGGPLIRTKRRDLEQAGVTCVPKTAGVRDGRPVLEDGRVLDVRNVIWCTGFHPGFDDWIELPVMEGAAGQPVHESGIVTDMPGLYFVGLMFLHALSSSMIHGVGRDARRIAEAVAARQRNTAPAAPELEVAAA